MDDLKYILKWNGKVKELFKMSKRKRNELLSKIVNKTRKEVTDIFDADFNDIKEIYKLIDLDYRDSASILIANQVPVPYSRLHVANDKTIDKGDDFDIIIFSEYDDTFRDCAQILGFIYSIDDVSALIPIGTVPGSNELQIFDTVFTKRACEYTLHRPTDDYDSKRIITNLIYGLDTYICRSWFLIQFILLNPQIYNTYKSPKPRKHYQSSNSEPLPIADDPKPQLPKPKHISPIKIVSHEIKDILTNQYSYDGDGLHRRNKRHTMCWYVRGHYRYYSNGTRVYIKPQWRGPMAQMKRAQVRQNIVDNPTNKII